MCACVCVCVCMRGSYVLCIFTRLSKQSTSNLEQDDCLCILFPSL